MRRDPEHWLIPFMDFVDDFRRSPHAVNIDQAPTTGSGRLDALLASTVEYLCREQGCPAPAWVSTVPSCAEPWFVSGVENLKAMALAASPVDFRKRKIFVLENFLSRV